MPATPDVASSVFRRPRRPGGECKQRDPHADPRRPSATGATERRKAPVSPDQQPVEKGIDAETKEGEKHHRLRTIDAGRVEGNGAEDHCRRQSDHDAPEEERRLVDEYLIDLGQPQDRRDARHQEHRQQTAQRREPDALVRILHHRRMVAGTEMLRHRWADRLHDAHQGNKHRHPEGNAQRHRRLFLSPGLAGHYGVEQAKQRVRNLGEDDRERKRRERAAFGKETGESVHDRFGLRREGEL